MAEGDRPSTKGYARMQVVQSVFRGESFLAANILLAASAVKPGGGRAIHCANEVATSKSERRKSGRWGISVHNVDLAPSSWAERSQALPEAESPASVVSNRPVKIAEVNPFWRGGLA